MKRFPPITFAVLLFLSPSLYAETVFGPGTVNVRTNEAILITTVVWSKTDFTGTALYFDGLKLVLYQHGLNPYPRFAVAGPRDVVVTNQTLITFQRLPGSSVKTLAFSSGSTNFITVPPDKTIQFFSIIGSGNYFAHTPNSTDVYQLPDDAFPSITGPATIEVVAGQNTAVSYYFTDEVVQIPPQGLPSSPAPALEVNIDKSFDLTNWIPTAVFVAEVQTNAFYRLRILK